MVLFVPAPQQILEQIGDIVTDLVLQVRERIQEQRTVKSVEWLHPCAHAAPFQQSLQYVKVKVPRIQFNVRLCQRAVVHIDGCSQCKLCSKTWTFHRCSLYFTCATLGSTVDFPSAIGRASRIFYVKGETESVEV